MTFSYQAQQIQKNKERKFHINSTMPTKPEQMVRFPVREREAKPTGQQTFRFDLKER